MSSILRRTLLAGAGSAAAVVVLDRAMRADAIGEPVENKQLANVAAPAAPTISSATRDLMRELARKLSEKPFEESRLELPPALAKINYDQYRDIRFKSDRAIWHGENLGFELQLFAAGWLYKNPVEIFIVGDDGATPILPVSGMFQNGRLLPDMPDNTQFALSGFRIHGPINRTDYLDEFVVFQGASYLRAVARGEQYGLSARGLAIDIGQPKGEEFPTFRTFYIEKPRRGAGELIVHALLDSPSCTGAYRFAIRHGLATTMDVEATIFPRKL